MEIELHHILFKIGQQISEVSFKILIGKLLEVEPLFDFKLLISFSISTWVVSVKVKLGRSEGTFCLIIRILGWFSYFFMAISIGSSRPWTGVKTSLHSKISSDLTAFSK